MHMQAVSLEQHNAVADLFWLEAVQRLGRSPKRMDRMDALASIYLSLTALRTDPRYFTPAYVAGVVSLEVSDGTGLSDSVIREAWAAQPGRWEFPFLLAYNAYFFSLDSNAASKLWLEASRLPNSPPYLVSLSARALAQGSSRSDAIDMLEALLPTLTNRYQRTAAEERLLLLRSEEILDRYDVACESYRERTGSWPDEPAQLFLSGEVPNEPRDLTGSPMRFDTSSGRCITRTGVIRVRDAEARERATHFQPRMR